MSDVVAEILADPAIALVGSALAVAGIALWLAAAWWAYSDASHRTERPVAGFLAAGWILLSTPLVLPLSLLIYAFARPQVTAGDQRSRALVRELAAIADEGPACLGCAAPVDASWLRCPRCETWLAAPCADCGSWSDSRLEICPWCGGEERDAPKVAAMHPAAVSMLPRTRRGRVAWRAVGPGSPAVHRQPNRRIPVSPDGRPLATARMRG